MWRLASIVALCLGMVPPVTADETPWSLVETSFPGSDGAATPATVLTFDPKKVNMQVVAVAFEQGKDGGVIPLADFAEFLATKHQTYRRQRWVAINGGFSSFRVDVPMGLLVVDGKVYSNLSLERNSPVSSSARSGTFRWAGILCQSADSAGWSIIASSDYRPGACRQAIQAGPVLVESNAKVAISAKEPGTTRPYNRTIACQLADGRLRFVVVTRPTHLLPLARWLVRSERDGGQGCDVALNLSGDTSSALSERKSPAARPVLYGEGSFPIPSAIVITTPAMGVRSRSSATRASSTTPAPGRRP